MHSKRFIVFISFMVATVIFAESKTNQTEKCLKMLRQQQFSALEKIARSAWAGPESGEWAMIATVVAENATSGRPLLERFANDSSVAGTNLYAELLVRCARGTEIPSWEREKRKLDELSIDEIWRTAPYLHNGSAESLMELLTDLNKNDRHGVTSKMNRDELEALVAYLLSL